MNCYLSHGTKKIGGTKVLNDVCLTVNEGTVVGLRGINGSGKTMLLRALAGLICLNTGTVQYDDKQLGRDISFPPSLGILIENPAFLDSYTGFQNLEMLASIKNEVDDVGIARSLHRVGLNPDNKKKYRKYSLGMKQRLGIAAAIMESPSFIFLDEPTNALDPEGVELLKEIVREERRRGAGIILASHDQEFTSGLSDVVYQMKDGCIKEMSAHAERNSVEDIK